MAEKTSMQRFEVALSFAGEDRAYVEMVARFLQAHGASLFYDDYQQTDLWGKDLYSHLSTVYSKAEKFVVMFVSRHYAEKVWTNHERRAAQSRALREKNEYILPVRFDDTEVDGLLPTIGFLDARKLSPEMIANRILEKLGRPVTLMKANQLPAPHCKLLNGQATFDCEAYDGRFEIGDADLLFETRWSGPGGGSVWCYNDAPSVRGVALIPQGKTFKDLRDVSTLDFTSRARRPQTGQYVVLQNTKGFFALLRIESVINSQLHFSYWIRPDGTGDFSSLKEDQPTDGAQGK